MPRGGRAAKAKSWVLWCGRVVARRLVALGMAFTLGAQVVFLAASADRPPLYAALTALGLVAAALAWLGVLRLETRRGLWLLASGLWAHAVSRVALLAMGFSRLPRPVNVAIALGFALAAIVASSWAAQPSRRPEARAALLRLALGVVGVAYFLGLISAIGGGRLAGVAGMLLATLGWSLAAPNLEAKGDA